MKRRVAAHRVNLPDGSCIQLAVVEIQGGIVQDVHCLHGEEPFTEWLGGEITVKKTIQGHLVAYKNNLIIE